MPSENRDDGSPEPKRNGKNVSRNVLFSNHLSGDSGDEYEEPSSTKISSLYLTGLVVSIILHVLDVGTDMYLAYQYYQFDEKGYFILTACFIILPAVINSLVSTRM